MGKNANRQRAEVARKNAAAQEPHPQDSLLSEGAVQRLRAHGLRVRDVPTFGPRHVAYPSGYMIVLPAAAAGNKIPGTESYFGEPPTPENATHSPSLNLWRAPPGWRISVHQYAPGPGPGDFTEEYGTEAQAIDAVLSYFLDPENRHFKAALEHWLQAGVRL